LDATIHVEWAHEGFHPGTTFRQIAVPRWADLLRAFGFPNEPQITSLTLDRGRRSGHLVFDIPDVGLGVAFDTSRFGGIDDDNEHERDRRCYIRFTDTLTSSFAQGRLDDGSDAIGV
jgi:hypothetical protein